MTQRQTLTLAPKPLENFIDNAHVATEHWSTNSVEDKSKFIPVTCPATKEVIGYAPISTIKDVDLAVKSANTAFSTWSALTIKSRVAILIRFHQLVIKHQEELANLIVLEHGKTFNEALAEVAKGNETVEYALSLPQLVQGRNLEVSRGVNCQDRREPLGVVASIVPFNFPFMVPFWTIAIAIAMGNTMIIKPSEKVPLTMSRVMDLFKEAGLPDGVVNLVHGAVNTVEGIVDHPLVKAVTFVGTSRVAELIQKRCTNLGKRCIALGGAKNHLVSAGDADINMTAADVVSSFTGCSGQRCMAASVLLTIGPQPELLKEISKRASSIVFGQDCAGQMGPVIDEPSQSKILKYINDSEALGAEILVDGRSWAKAAEGWRVGPTVILHKSKTDPALHDEIFGPVISVLQVSSREEAIEIENSNPYGNAACIYTSDGGTSEYFIKHFSAGMCGVNIGVPVPREPFSFGGWNDSKFGLGDITGDGAIEFFSKRRKVTTKWAPPAEKSWMS